MFEAEIVNHIIVLFCIKQEITQLLSSKVKSPMSMRKTFCMNSFQQANKIIQDGKVLIVGMNIPVKLFLHHHHLFAILLYTFYRKIR